MSHLPVQTGMLFRVRFLLALFGVVLLAGFTSQPGSDRQARVTLFLSRATVVFGEPVRLSGVALGLVDAGAVTIVARRAGAPVFRPIAGVPRGAGGRWSLTSRPALGTSYQARFGDARSPVLSVGVRPRVGLSLRDGFFFTSVVAARSFQGRFVFFQRRSADGVWISVKKVVVGRPPRRFRAALPPGRSLVRVYLPRGQAGAGYLAGYSRAVAASVPD